MPARRFLVSTVATLLTATACVAARAAEPVYQPFPTGYGYLEPAEMQALRSAVGKGDSAVVREHGWKLWAGIMQPAAGMNWPVWYTWPTTSDAFPVTPASGSAAAPAGDAVSGAASTNASKRHMGRRGASTLTPVMTKAPVYDIPAEVSTAYPGVTGKHCSNNQKPAICDGAHFAYNGDIMIATESLSKEALGFIRDPKQPVYKQSELKRLYAENDPARRVHELNAPASYVVTKHMYWPVKARGLTALPVWRDDFGAQYSGYAGYEGWAHAAAIDPSGARVGKTARVSYLYNVKKHNGKPWPTITRTAKVYGLNDFYHHRVTQADWDSFNEADKAIINAASYWLSNKPFGVGDYLVTVAMHINTKEVASWALQSVWWSDRPDAMPHAANRPALAQAAGPWKHYLLTEAYGIPEKGNPHQLPVATNPYIELISHPVGTSCYTCHARAGWPGSDKPKKGTASYQNPDCPGLRARLNPNSDCLKAITLTDFQWIIPDRALKE